MDGVVTRRSVEIITMQRAVVTLTAYVLMLISWYNNGKIKTYTRKGIDFFFGGFFCAYVTPVHALVFLPLRIHLLQNCEPDLTIP